MSINDSSSFLATPPDEREHCGPLSASVIAPNRQSVSGSEALPQSVGSREEVSLCPFCVMAAGLPIRMQAGRSRWVTAVTVSACRLRARQRGKVPAVLCMRLSSSSGDKKSPHNAPAERGSVRALSGGVHGLFLVCLQMLFYGGRTEQKTPTGSILCLRPACQSIRYDFSASINSYTLVPGAASDGLLP